jgi:colicin import membrane protein
MTADVYHDPYRVPAWILAMLVHGAFFSLLYFGFSWQSLKIEQRSAATSVELWAALPAPPRPAEVKVEEVKVEEIAPTPPPPDVVVKPDIVIPEKKPVEVKPEVVKPLPKPEIKKPEIKKPEVKPVEVKKTETKPPEVKKVEVKVVKTEVKNGVAGGQGSAPGGQKSAVSAADMQMARDKLAQEAAIGKIVDEYSARISAKIKRNIVEPPDVLSDVRAEFLVTVLPGGRVLPPRLIKPSGNASYDIAVERAILKSEPLPMPDDANLFKNFRELKLGFQPEKQKGF